MFFQKVNMSTIRSEIVAEGKDPQDILAIVASRWKELADSEKEQYNRMAADDKERNPLDRILHEPIAPRELIEEIYYLGLIEGVDKSAKSINILRLGKLLLDSRLALAVEFTKICKAQNLEHRAYYRMITEHGGFQKLDFSGAPKYKLLDLDAEKRNAEKAALEEKNNPQIIPKETLVEQEAQNVAMITESSETISIPNNADDEDVFDWNVGQSGPTLM
jgi:hypothetical protein